MTTPPMPPPPGWSYPSPPQPGPLPSQRRPSQTGLRVLGRIGDVLPDIAGARADSAARDGWVMDLFLLRKT
ncbi:MAG: hypothetical protein K0U84_08905 [Actinomycetia bacterium]|nr:hypothetical protein [Actinomycetes bacterium]